ncbi:LADA_0E01706g1_1 [Lachancea dasiensis]|uniref:U1 small nuclear ribonucleoprotein component SNU71 n=1 Tax=Lachancea dasiensis TaxID=1072105 RepID=A0A1G4JAI4_9SACH|nr:LADA_0E01706g1_1 [Lachancea dasiensis]
MNSMVYVCPSAYLASQDAKLWHSETFKPGFVPILRTDLLRVRDTLDKVVSSVNERKAVHIYQNDQGEMPNLGNPATADSKEDDGNATEQEYQDVKQFLPISLEQQLCTISLVLSHTNITHSKLAPFVADLEALSAKLLGVSKVLQCWSFLKGLETTTVFFRSAEPSYLASLVHCLNAACAVWSKDEGSEGTRVHFDENTARYLEEHGLGATKLDNSAFEESVALLARTLDQSQIEQVSEKDENRSVDYEVDVSTLSDLPHSSLDQLCKDIVRFRTRVVTIEKEKRAKAEYEENRRMGQHMMKVFDQIRKSKGGKAAVEDGENEDGASDQEDEEDNEDDLAVEKRQEEKREKEAEHSFKELLERYTANVEPRLRSLQQQLAHEKAYESKLQQERPLHLKELLHLAYSPYYDHHRSYKDEETRRDEEDREHHGIAEALRERQQSDQEETGEGPVAPTGEPNKFKIQIGKAQAEGKSLLPEDGEALVAVLGSLRDSNVIQELVVEFLGEPDQDLADYILEHLRNHRDRQALLDELRETFDEDADTIVQRIWEKLNSLVNG